MNDSDSEYEESEYLVFADFKNQLPPHTLKHEDAAIKIIGVESDNPMAEVNGSIFKGTYENSIGTNVFFEKDTDRSPADPLFEAACRQKYQYLDKSDKVISFERAYIEHLPTEPDKSTMVPDTITEDTDTPQTTKLNITYKDAINKFGEEN
ncbi:uncharacterized protein LOC108153383 [Drosophila miranda]|uniref:uncharacterized protein LOC108153383 n=1 Tax=Drosophila miranda TaxID=7229 RepID=UPI0007E61D1F|nr:uncharacterized protein LOC108153383 [Drosophila miranda]XP_017138845.1 uncharacterized protein LOC108153383 [Drosophila miranda]